MKKLPILLLFLLVSFLTYAQQDTHKRLFILLGQSNMSGRAPIENADTAALPLVKLLDVDGRFEVARNPLNRFSNIRKGITMQKLGPGYHFAKTLSEQLQDTIYLVVNARGGTALERFMKKDPAGYYKKTLSRIKQALRAYPDMKPEAIIWHQGESNRDDYQNYLNHLNKLVTDLRTDLGIPDLPFIAGEIGKWNPDYSHIVKRIAAIPDSISYASLVSSEELTNIDEFHFDAKSQKILGERYAKKYLEISGIEVTRLAQIRAKLFDPNSSGVLVASHRGDWRNACENSLEAIENAIHMGVDIVEVDLGRTKDGHLILMHDQTLDRTTTGKGKVEDHTLAEIKDLRLRNGCHIKTIYKVPTLEEALLLAKGKVMLNLDKAFDYFDQVYELLEKTGTTNLVIMKSNAPAEDVKRDYGKYLDKVVFMPKVNLDDKDAIQKLNDYLRVLKPVAIEFKFAYDTNPLPYEVKKIMAGKSHIWYNTLWDTHAGGHDDDCSLLNKDKGYGYLINNLGATILQTDRPAYLIDYLKYKAKVMNCDRDWTYLKSENEYQAPSVSNFTIKESFLKGKQSPQTNEDGIIVTPYFAAVIDGATAKSTFTHDGKKTGRLAMELALEAIREFPKDIDATEALRRITEKTHQFYVEHNLLDELKTEPGKRFTANGVIYSYTRNEVWQVGDCQCIIGNLYSSNEKEIDAIMANARAAFNEVALLNGATMEGLEAHDLGRDFIYPFLQKQALLQNCPIEGQRFAFPVFDGFPIQMKQVNVFPVGNADEIILSSDGYPHLYSTLHESECYLADILEKDPLCMRLYKSTKGVQKGNCSFDDRAYLRIKMK